MLGIRISRLSGSACGGRPFTKVIQQNRFINGSFAESVGRGDRWTERIWPVGKGIECNLCRKWAGLSRSDIIGPARTDQAGRFSVTE